SSDVCSSDLGWQDKTKFCQCREGGKSVARINSLNSFRFAPVRHLPLTLPVYLSFWPNKKRVAVATLNFTYSTIAPDCGILKNNLNIFLIFYSSIIPYPSCAGIPCSAERLTDSHSFHVDIRFSAFSTAKS